MRKQNKARSISEPRVKTELFLSTPTNHKVTITVTDASLIKTDLQNFLLNILKDLLGYSVELRNHLNVSLEQQENCYRIVSLLCTAQHNCTYGWHWSIKSFSKQTYWFFLWWCGNWLQTRRNFKRHVWKEIEMEMVALKMILGACEIVVL